MFTKYLTRTFFVLIVILIIPIAIFSQAKKQVTFKAISCIGDINEKTVTVFFKITNVANQKHVIHLVDNGNAKAKVDTSFTDFICKNYSLGIATGGENYLINTTISPDSAITGSITYKNIPTDAKKIRKATLFYYDNLRNSKDEQTANESGIIDLGEISIIWRKIAKPKFVESRHCLGVSVGVKSIYFKDGYSESSPINTSIVYEKKIKNLPLTVGGTFSYSSHTYTYENDYDTESFSFKENAIYAGLRINGYFNNYLGISKKYETYVGVSSGYIFLYATENINNSNTAKSGFASGLHIGARRYVAPNFSLWVEGGTSSLSHINGGLSFKF